MKQGVTETPLDEFVQTRTSLIKEIKTKFDDVNIFPPSQATPDID